MNPWGNGPTRASFPNTEAPARRVVGRNCFIVGAGQVLPIPVERGYASGLEVLWVVRKADSVVDPISAKRVLTGLLQVDNDSNLHPSQQR